MENLLMLNFEVLRPYNACLVKGQAIRRGFLEKDSDNIQQ